MSDAILDELFLAVLEKRDGQYRYPKEDIGTVLGIACLFVLPEVDLPPHAAKIVRWLIDHHGLRSARSKRELFERLAQSLSARPIAPELALRVAEILGSTRAPHGSLAKLLGVPGHGFEPRKKGNVLAVRVSGQIDPLESRTEG